MTIINNGRLWAGIGIEILLVISVVSIVYFIFTSGKIRKDYLSSKGLSKKALWLAVLLQIIVIVLVYFSVIESSVIKF